MSETMEAPVVEANDAPADDRFAGMEFGTDQEGAEAESGEGQVEEDSTPEPEKPEPKPDTTPDYIKRRIGKSVALQRQAERERDAANERSANLEKALRIARGEEEAPRELTPDEIRAEERQRIEQSSKQEQQVADFNQTCSTLAQSLASSFGADAVVPATKRLAESVGLDFGNSEHQSVIRDIAKLPNAAQVYHALSNDPDAAYRIFEADDKREGYAELRDFSRALKAEAAQEPARLPAQAAAPAQPRPVSQAPRPAGRTPAPSRSSSRSVYDDNVSMDDFVAMRNKRG